MSAKRRVLLCVALIASLTAVAVPIVAPILAKPVVTSVTPEEIHALPGMARMIRTLSSVSEDQYLRVIVSMSTTQKRVHFRWEGKASASAWKSKTFTFETVSFEPTGLCRSRASERVFYVAGRAASGPRLEKWEINSDFGLAVYWEQSAGVFKTSIDTAGITKTSIPVSNGLQNVCDMTTIVPSPISGQPEELWVMEWETRHVFAVSLSTGALTLRVSNTTSGPYCAINGRTHSTYGDVVFFDRRHWNTSAVAWTDFASDDPTLDPNRLVLYDQDLNGIFEGSLVIPASEYGTHAIYTTGEFTDDPP